MYFFKLFILFLVLGLTTSRAQRKNPQEWIAKIRNLNRVSLSKFNDEHAKPLAEQTNDKYPSEYTADAKLQSKSTISAKPQLEPITDTKPQPKPTVDFKYQLETIADAKPQPKLAVDAKPQIELTADANPQLERIAEAKSQAKPTEDVKSQLEPNADANPESRPRLDAIYPPKLAAHASPIDATADAKPQPELAAFAKALLEVVADAKPPIQPAAVTKSMLALTIVAKSMPAPTAVIKSTPAPTAVTYMPASTVVAKSTHAPTIVPKYMPVPTAIAKFSHTPTILVKSKPTNNAVVKSRPANTAVVKSVPVPSASVITTPGLTPVKPTSAHTADKSLPKPIEYAEPPFEHPSDVIPTSELAVHVKSLLDSSDYKDLLHMIMKLRREHFDEYEKFRKLLKPTHLNHNIYLKELISKVYYFLIEPPSMLSKELGYSMDNLTKLTEYLILKPEIKYKDNGKIKKVYNELFKKFSKMTKDDERAGIFSKKSWSVLFKAILSNILRDLRKTFFDRWRSEDSLETLLDLLKNLNHDININTSRNLIKIKKYFWRSFLDALVVKGLL